MMAPPQQPLTTTQGVRKKRSRPYSRRGCRRCKRMKVKCDEAQPACLRCSRANSPCEYPEPDPATGTVPTVATSQSPVVHLPMNNGVHTVSPGEESNESMDKSLLELLDDDLSLQMDQAIQHHMGGGATPTPNIIPKLQVKTDMLQAIYSTSNTAASPVSPSGILSSETIYHFPRNCFNTHAIDPSHKRYMDLFYDEFSEILMPLRASEKGNTLRDILLQYSLRKDYLYYAVLSSGARLSYKKTTLDEDERYFTSFLKKTSEMLEDYRYIQSFCSIGGPPGQSLEASKVVTEVLEPLLLTILLLTSDNASSMKHSWRGHLRGAKELLQLVFVENKFPHTKILQFCKCWFSLFELLAGLSAPHGGTLLVRNNGGPNMNSLLWMMSVNLNDRYEEGAMRELKMVTDDGFIFIFGVHSGLLNPLNKLIEWLRNSSVSQPGAHEIFSLTAELQQYRGYSVEKADYDDETTAWFNCIHQSFVDAALLTIMTKFLQVGTPANPVIQELVHSILSNITTTLHATSANPKTQFKLMMVQWPLLTAGLHSVTKEDMKTTEELFVLLTGLGSGSAKYSLQKIRKAWSRAYYAGEQTVSSEGQEEVDIVTY